MMQPLWLLLALWFLLFIGDRLEHTWALFASISISSSE